MIQFSKKHCIAVLMELHCKPGAHPPLTYTRELLFHKALAVLLMEKRPHIDDDT